MPIKIDPSVFYFVFFIDICVFLVSSNQSVDWRYTACKPRNCGNGPNISYPFQIIEEGSGVAFCGYPGFEVKCENNTPIYKTSLSKYIIEEISPKNQTFRLVNSDVMNMSSSCRVPHTDFTFDRSSLSFGPNFVDLYLFYNCSNGFPEEYMKNPITCSSNNNFNVYNSFAVLGMMKDGVNGSSMPCESFVHAPVEVEGNLTVEEGKNYLKLLENGFTLQWSGLRCGGCKKSGGHCGYKSRKPVCFCPHGVRREKCNAETKSKKVVIVPVTIGAAVILVICLACFMMRRHYKWSKISSYLSSRESVKDLEAASDYFGVPVFSYKELDEATHSFAANKELGDGGFGAVYYGKLKDGREVAVKRLYEHNYKRVEQFMNEVEILTRLRHPNLVLFYGCTSHKSRELLLVYEYIPNGTVADHLHGDRAKPSLLTWPIRMNIAIETASALAYLHKSDIIHRDVKSNNILLDENFSVKVADFGLSRLFPNDVSHVSTAPQGTPGYVDPEYHQCYQLTDKSDVYSFGVVLVELISSMPAVDISRHRHEINLSNLALSKIQKCEFDELIDSSLGFGSDDRVNRMTTSVAELAFRCLQFDKEMRPTMDEVLVVLKEIQAVEIKEGTESVGQVKSVKPPPSPESEEARLLKNPIFPPSPVSVTGKWHSGSTTTPYTSS